MDQVSEGDAGCWKLREDFVLSLAFSPAGDKPPLLRRDVTHLPLSPLTK